MSPDDIKLVEMTTTLGKELEISSLDIRKVFWTEIVPAGRNSYPMPLDWCLFFMRHSICMPLLMMGKLSLAEWRPLIASSLLFEKKLRRTVSRKWWQFVVLPAVILLVGTFTIVAVFPGIYWISLFPLVLVIPIAILGNRRYAPFLKRARLESDSQTSRLIGFGSLLDVLQKINMMIQSNQELSRPYTSSWAVGLPTLTQRIENIQTLSDK